MTNTVMFDPLGILVGGPPSNQITAWKGKTSCPAIHTKGMDSLRVENNLQSKELLWHTWIDASGK
jgi:hypothetical protein